MLVDHLADARAGDKGDTLILAVRARHPGDYHRLVTALSPERVTRHFGGLLTGPVQRRPLPGLSAVVLVLPGALGGGVTGSPTLDGHGKALSYHLLAMPIDRN